MEYILEFIESLVLKLPPLLQLILGAAIVGGTIKLMIVIVEFFEKKRGKKE